MSDVNIVRKRAGTTSILSDGVNKYFYLFVLFFRVSFRELNCHSVYVIEMGSGTMMYLPSFGKVGSGIQKLLGGIHKQTPRQQDDLISLLLCFQYQENRLKTRNLY
jgi:hypothetical protein